MTDWQMMRYVVMLALAGVATYWSGWYWASPRKVLAFALMVIGIALAEMAVFGWFR